MIHAYNEIYLNTVMKNLAALFDLAINAENYDEDERSLFYVVLTRALHKLKIYYDWKQETQYITLHGYKVPFNECIRM